MDERTLLYNGQFLHSLDEWEGDGTYSAGDGDDQYGVAALAVGQSIEQSFTVDNVRAYTLHLALKCASTVTSGQVTVEITDEDGNTVATLNPTTLAGAWTENTFTTGLAPDMTYTLTLANVSAGAAVKVDDVWLWYVPATRAQLANKVHTKLGRLATERNLSTVASGSQTEGDYTEAVSAGLRAVGAVDEESDQADVRYLDSALLDTCLDAIEQEMLERLHRDYSVETDISVDGRSESRSQIAGALEKLTRGESGPKRIVTRRLTHPDWD